MLSRDKRAAVIPVDLTRMAPSCPSLTAPGPPRAQAGGLLGPEPGLRVASSSRNPTTAGRAPHSHPTEAPFRRRRGRAQSPAPPTRDSRGRWDRLRSPPAAGLPGPARAQQAAPRHSGLKSWPRRPGTATGRDGQASPARPPGSRARAPIPGSQPTVPASLPPRRRGCPRLCTFLVARLGCPEAPFSLPGVGELRLAKKRPSFQSGARRPALREREEERRGEGDTAWTGARDFQKPSRGPVPPPPLPPGRQGAE
ncbi:putative uncharacterized protein FRMD6-AS1 [Ovis aries]|uniref:putative uncharacterized protein FRMD6-AS1 n=1 Tax=Ovis aries TaxID=9940 RepID=UPI00100E7226|nr:putative uncharacterized protein FRMD6-AS1 [Ovis aries]